jgi:DNA ligase-1
METQMPKLPTLFKRNSDGTMQQWTIWTEGSTIFTEFGRVYGKLQTTSDPVSFGKNTGRSNSTTAEQQASLESKSKWTKALKKGYHESYDSAKEGKVDALIEGGINPILAHVYEDHGHKIKYPAYVQRKYDGHRMICVVEDADDISLWSRTRKPIKSLPHIIEAVRSMVLSGKVQSPVILDGECYNHSYKDNFEDLTSFIRNEFPKPGHEVVQYHVYDIADTEQSYKTRGERLHAMLAGAPDCIKEVQTFKVDTEAEAKVLLNQFLEEGYEGAIIRNGHAKYENKRSYHLQKLKLFKDSEWKIVGVKAGRGKMAKCGIFTCDDGHGGTFDCKMEGPLESLEDYLTNPKDYIGQLLTVRYQGLTSANNQPRFPVGLRLRKDI